jgi:hypothetical protein
VAGDVPSITFAYSDLLDDACSNLTKEPPDAQAAGEAKRLLPQLEAAWQKEGPALLQAAQAAIGQPFGFREAKAALMTCGIPSMSHPLLINMKAQLHVLPPKDETAAAQRFVDTVFKELLHRYLGDIVMAQGGRDATPLRRKYSTEPPVVRNHLLLFAVQEVVYAARGRGAQLQDAKAFEAGLRNASLFARAREIVQAEHAETFLNDLRAPAAAADERSAAEAGIRDLFRELNEARVKRDRAALERLYADEFLWIHSSGLVANKADQVEELLASDPSRPIPAPQPEEVLVYGDVAITRNPRKEIAGSSTYVKRGGRWQVVQIQGTRLPPERKAVAVDPAILESYVGTYQQPNGATVAVTREGQSLTIQVGGRGKRALTAVSDTRFFDPLNAEWTFTKDAKGQVSYVRRMPDGQEAAGTKSTTP